MEPIKKEDKFLLLCARTQVQDNQLELAQELAGDTLNWDYLWGKSRINWVTPLIYKNLLKLNGIIPPDIMEQFKTDYILQSLNSQRRYQDLGELLRVLNSQKIQVIPHKGVVLGEIVYQDIAFRPMSDFDLLIKPQDWPKITRILQDLGYSGIPKTKISSFPKEYHLGCGNKRGTGLEFKFNLYWLDIPEFKKESAWGDAIPAKIAQENTLIPSCEDHLLILSLGLLRQRYTGLIWFCDIHECIRHYKERIDWEKLIKKARAKGVSAYLYYGLFFTDKLLGPEMPPAILEKLKPNLLRRRLFAQFHLVDNIVKFSGLAEKRWRHPRLHLLELFLIGKIGLNLKITLKSILYFLQLAFQSKKFTGKRTA